jgi:hypothetical protein
MISQNNTLYRSAAGPSATVNSVRTAMVMVAFVVFAMIVGYAMRHVDSPGGIVTWSGAFNTDEGYHAKWAQNAVRFGTLGDPYDFSWFPAGFLHNIAAYGVFRVFGPSFEALRVYAAFLAALALILYWGLLAQAPDRFPRWQAVAILVVTVNYPAYARVLFIEPLGIVLSLASISLAVRTKAPPWVCALSIVLAFAAFLTKISFVDVTCTVLLVWVARLTIWRESDRADSAMWVAFAGSIGVMIGLIAALAWIFQASIVDFALYYYQTQYLGLAAIPLPLKILSSEIRVFRDFLENTHHAAFLVSLIVAAAVVAFKRPWQRTGPSQAPSTVFDKFASWARALRDHKLDVAMVAWLVIGFLLRGSTSYQPSRYFFPLLFPLSYAAVRLLQQSARALSVADLRRDAGHSSRRAGAALLSLALSKRRRIAIREPCLVRTRNRGESAAWPGGAVGRRRCDLCVVLKAHSSNRAGVRPTPLHALRSTRALATELLRFDRKGRSVHRTVQVVPGCRWHR